LNAPILVVPRLQGRGPGSRSRRPHRDYGARPGDTPKASRDMRISSLGFDERRRLTCSNEVFYRAHEDEGAGGL
jgi:hypothetical protein